MTELTQIMCQRSYLTWLVNKGNNYIMHGLQDTPGKEEKKRTKEMPQDERSEAGRTEVSQGSRRTTKQVL